VTKAGPPVKGGRRCCVCYLILLWTRDQTHLAPAFPTRAPSTGSGQALRKKREGRGTHCVGDASEIKSLGHSPKRRRFRLDECCVLGLAARTPSEMAANSLRNKPFGQANSGTPLPPGPMESGTYTRDSTKIFGFKELIAKIFRTKDLASGTVAPGRYARRVMYIRGDVLGRCVDGWPHVIMLRPESCPDVKVLRSINKSNGRFICFFMAVEDGSRDADPARGTAPLKPTPGLNGPPSREAVSGTFLGPAGASA
jgi:hypothetical protein